MTHASLFSGIGGPEIAAAMLGWDNLFHCEINPFGRKVLDYWFPNSKSYEDITKTDFTEWRGRVDVLTGGFPCQPFSYAGQRRGADDDRYLWPYMFKAIDAIRPTWVVAENVAGITTMVEQGEVVEVGCQASLFEEVDDIHRYRFTETFTLQRICDDLESHGYAVQPVLVPACAVGAPHRRDRVFIVANRSVVQRDGSEFGKCGRRKKVPELGDNNSKGIFTADSHGGYDGGAPGEDAGESGKERVQERDEIRQSGEPDQVRPEIRGLVADTESQQGGRLQPRQPRRCESKQGQLGGRGGEDDAERYASYTNCQRSNKPNSATKPSEAQRFHCEENNKRGIAGLGRWDSFPTVSPVYRGNDGIPFDVDSLAVPFSKWRTESLKAYGNAIVPQVMYEIFRAIDIVSNQ